jgi:hypothetical protein
LNFDIADVRTTSLPSDTPLLLSESGCELELRLPNSLDLLQLTDCSTVAEMRSRLFEECVVRVTHEGAAQVSELPPQIVELAIERMGEADPQADVEVDLNCPECRHGWQTCFDIVSYLWTELQAWARQMLCEVHLLAASYGWRESEILQMSAPRRRSYLEILAG